MRYLQAFSLGVIAPLQRTIHESAGNKDQGATRAALRRWAGERLCGGAWLLLHASFVAAAGRVSAWAVPTGSLQGAPALQRDWLGWCAP